MNQIFRVSMSFAIVLVAYWAYALVVVPAISPTADSEDRKEVSIGFIMGAEERAELQAKELSALFPPGSWELVDKPKVLESDQAKLLVGDYTTKPDGRVLLKPCTIIFFPKKELLDAPLAEREAIIMEAPEGALLQFDEEFDLSRAKIGHPIGGTVTGPVTIRSQGKLDDPNDDLRISTRDVQLTEQWVTTDAAVRFQYGKHSGSGRRMRMKLEQDNEDAAGKRKPGQAPRIKGMRSFLLRKVDYLRMLLPDEEKKKTEGEEPKVAQTANEKDEPKLIPVEVGCTGEFRFDVAERRAAFKDEVVVSRFRTDGPADQLLCDELVIHFAERKNKKPADAQKASKNQKDKELDNITPSWLEARGIKRPAEIRSTVEKVEAFARELQYYLTDRRIVLQDAANKEPVRLNQADNTFVAKYIEYRPEKGSIGQLVADGPGVTTARLDEKTQQRFTATWQKELRLRPHEKNQVISLTGGATLDYGPVGNLSATSIHFFLIEKPKEEGNTTSNVKSDKISTNLQPDRMQADGDVKIESKQISGEVDQFQVWFEVDESKPSGYNASLIQPPGRTNTPPPPVSNNAYPRHTQPLGGQPPQGQPLGNYPPGMATPIGPQAASPGMGMAGTPYPVTSPPGMEPITFPGATAPAEVPQKEEPKQHFHVKGRLLQAHVLLRDTITPQGKKKRETEVTKLTILDNVELTETETDKPGVEPIIAKGDRVQVQDATLPTTSISMFGRPAEFVGRGLGLAGANINLNRGSNRLWVNGPGTMRLPPMEKDLQGRPNKQPESAIITWQQEMDFDGRTITFLDQVIAETKNQKLYTEQLSATLTKKIDFAKADQAISDTTMPGESGRPELLLLTCHGGVKLNSSMYDDLGRLESIEAAEANSLKVDNSTGEVYAEGPGWVQTVRRGGAKGLQQFGPGGMTSARPQPVYGAAPNQAGFPAPTSEKLTYIKIRFLGNVDGKIDERLMAFNEQVHGVVGQVLDWQQTLPVDNADALGDDGATFRCRRLELVQMSSPTGGDPNVEMEATGNVTIEGKQFTARGHRASYSRQKELLILEGDGRTEAELYRQKQIGGALEKFSAKKIMYWPETKACTTSGTQSLNLQMDSPR